MVIGEVLGLVLWLVIWSCLGGVWSEFLMWLMCWNSVLVNKLRMNVKELCLEMYMVVLDMIVFGTREAKIGERRLLNVEKGFD